MKLFAVLKDSFREAIDAKVFYVMIGLSTLLIVLVAGISFEPGSADKMVKEVVDKTLNADARQSIQEMFHGGGPQGAERTVVFFEPKSVEPEGSGSGSSTSYRIRLRARYLNLGELEKIQQDPTPLINTIKERFGAFDETFHLFEVSDIQVSPDEPAASGIKVPTVLVDFKARPLAGAQRLWPHKVTVFYGAWTWGIEFPLGGEIYFIEDMLVNGIGAWVAILISIVISALFIPNMLRKGTVDLLLVKPISRAMLLIYKYLGGLIFIFLNTAFVVIGIWTVLGLRSGIWATGFLLVIPIITFFFAILYSVSTLFGVLSRSAIVAILMTCFVWFVLYGIGEAYITVDNLRALQDKGALPPQLKFSADDKKIGDTWWYKGIKGVHFVVPRTRDLDHLTKRYLITDLLTANQIKEQKFDSTDMNWGESISVSCAFIAVMLGLSCWRFASRDY